MLKQESSTYRTDSAFAGRIPNQVRTRSKRADTAHIDKVPPIPLFLQDRAHGLRAEIKTFDIHLAETVEFLFGEFKR